MPDVPPHSEHVVFDAVSLVRGSRTVFDQFSLTVGERRVGLIGNNGSGKSTLLRLAAGLLLPDSGKVTVEGLETRAHRGELPGHVGFLFQNPDHQILFPTVGEEIAFGLAEKGIKDADAHAAARELLAANGCTGWEKLAVHELSEGQKQLVCLLSVIAPEPSILLLDEPFSSLDLPTRLDLSERLRSLPQAIVMASHDFDFLASFDRLIWLDDRRVRADDRPRAVISAYEAEVRGGAMPVARRA